MCVFQERRASHTRLLQDQAGASEHLLELAEHQVQWAEHQLRQTQFEVCLLSLNLWCVSVVQLREAKEQREDSISEIPSKFAFIYDENEDKDGITEWFNYKGLTWIAE